MLKVVIVFSQKLMEELWRCLMVRKRIVSRFVFVSQIMLQMNTGKSSLFKVSIIFFTLEHFVENFWMFQVVVLTIRLQLFNMIFMEVPISNGILFHARKNKKWP